MQVFVGKRVVNSLPIFIKNKFRIDRARKYIPLWRLPFNVSSVISYTSKRIIDIVCGAKFEIES